MPESEYEAQHEAKMQQFCELSTGSGVKYYFSLDYHPDNGKHGIWLVIGIRHSCVITCVNTARDAFDNRWAKCPGVYVGILTKTKEMLISLLSMLPFVTIFSSSESSRRTAFALGVLYIGLCCLGTYIVAMCRTRWEKVDKNSSNMPLHLTNE